LPYNLHKLLGSSYPESITIVYTVHTNWTPRKCLTKTLTIGLCVEWYLFRYEDLGTKIQLCIIVSMRNQEYKSSKWIMEI